MKLIYTKTNSNADTGWSTVAPTVLELTQSTVSENTPVAWTSTSCLTLLEMRGFSTSQQGRLFQNGGMDVQ